MATFFKCFAALLLLVATALAQNEPFKPPVGDIEEPESDKPNTTYMHVWRDERCTDKSFTIPSWIMYNLTLEHLVTWPAASNPQGDVSFTLVNRATDQWYEVGCTIHGDTPCTLDGVESDDSLKITIHIFEAEAAVNVTQTWTCADKVDLYNNTVPITFTGIGSISSEIRCGYYGRKYIDEIEHVGACRGEDKLIRATLLQPYNIKPSNTGPPGLTLPSCDVLKENPSWNVSNFHFYNSTVWRYPFWGIWWWQPSLSLNMDIVNNNADFSVYCPNYYMTWGDVWHIPDPVTQSCSPPYYPSGEMDGRIETDVTVDLRVMSIALKQSWFCEDEGSMIPSRITAQGVAHLPKLNCTVEDYGITTLYIPWQHDVENSYTTCSLPGDTYLLEGATLSREPVDPLSLSDRSPTYDGCTVKSMNKQNNTYQNSYSYGWEALEVSVWAEHTGQGRTIYLDYATMLNVTEPENPTWDEMEWHWCPKNPDAHDCRFKYDHTNHMVYMDYRWTCDENDHDHPVMFESWLHFNVSSNYTCWLEEYYAHDNELAWRCYWNETFQGWRLPDLMDPGLVLESREANIEDYSEYVPESWLAVGTADAKSEGGVEAPGDTDNSDETVTKDESNGGLEDGPGDIGSEQPVIGSSTKGLEGKVNAAGENMDNGDKGGVADVGKEAEDVSGGNHEESDEISQGNSETPVDSTEN